MRPAQTHIPVSNVRLKYWTTIHQQLDSEDEQHKTNLINAYCLHNRCNKHNECDCEPFRFTRSVIHIEARFLVHWDVVQQPTEQLWLQKCKQILDDFETHSECVRAAICKKESLPEWTIGAKWELIMISQREVHTNAASLSGDPFQGLQTGLIPLEGEGLPQQWTKMHSYSWEGLSRRKSWNWKRQPP